MSQSANTSTETGAERRHEPWWRSIGPALITACVVFDPGSLLISSNVGCVAVGTALSGSPLMFGR